MVTIMFAEFIFFFIVAIICIIMYSRFSIESLTDEEIKNIYQEKKIKNESKKHTELHKK